MAGPLLGEPFFHIASCGELVFRTPGIKPLQPVGSPVLYDLQPDRGTPRIFHEVRSCRIEHQRSDAVPAWSDGHALFS